MRHFNLARIKNYKKILETPIGEFSRNGGPSPTNELSLEFK